MSADLKESQRRRETGAESKSFIVNLPGDGRALELRDRRRWQ